MYSCLNDCTVKVMAYFNSKATPTNDTDNSCLKSCRTCLTNHMGSISHHSTSLVINSLGGGHTYIQTDVRTEIILSMPGLKTNVSSYARLLHSRSL